MKDEDGVVVEKILEREFVGEIWAESQEEAYELLRFVSMAEQQGMKQIRQGIRFDEN